MASKQYKKLHDAQTQISDGEHVIVDNSSTLIVAIAGSSTSFQVSFTASIDGTNYFPISGNKMGDYSVFASSVTTIGDAYEFDVSALFFFKAKITAIGNGNITVVANAI